MRLTNQGLELIKSFEGCKLTAYLDLGGICTIGWGHTGKDVIDGLTWTQEQADAQLLADLELVENMVLACISVQITDNQLSALDSFVFNVGLGYPGEKDGFKVLRDGRPSTMLRLIESGEFILAAYEFPKWDRVNGIVSPGILRRRLAEKELFLAGLDQPKGETD